MSTANEELKKNRLLTKDKMVKNMYYRQALECSWLRHKSYFHNHRRSILSLLYIPRRIYIHSIEKNTKMVSKCKDRTQACRE